MSGAAGFHLEDRDGGRAAVLTGDWTAVGLGHAPERLAAALAREGAQAVDMTGVGRCDTSGAYAVVQAVQKNGGVGKVTASPEVSSLLTLVETATKAEPTPEWSADRSPSSSSASDAV